jgi:hypothetical protein
MKIAVIEAAHAGTHSLASPRRKRELMVFIVVCCLSVVSCSSDKKPLAEAPPPGPAAVLEGPPTAAAKLPPPELDQVQEAVKRVFKESAIIDQNQKPSFIAGDFNGDLSEDIAVIVKPTPEKLSDMNKEFSPWLLRDPFGTHETGTPRLGVAASDVLLAVIHGFGDKGWRDPEATQTFLLKNAAGSELETRAGKDFLTANQGKKLPTLRGDLIGEVIAGKSGYLYYAGATYSWYDPKTFTGETEPRRSHGSADQRAKK